MELIRINSADTVAVAMHDLKKGQILSFENEKLEVLEDIPNGHKIALAEIQKGEKVLKYGSAIGEASMQIKRGEWVHSHNVSFHGVDKKSWSYHFDPSKVVMPGTTKETFMGYKRSSGEVGIRNYLGIIPTVFCANGPLEKIAKLAGEKFPKTENFDGVLPLTHEFGCSQTGYDLEITGKILSGLIQNANFGGVLVVSLGCEINDLKQLKKYLNQYDEKRVRFLVLQECDDELAEGLSLCQELYDELIQDQRKAVNFDQLHIALNCGGSDGFSGITANSIVGGLTEILVSKGATVNMTEVPEMFGAENILMNRSIDRDVYQKFVDMIEDYLAYFKRYGEEPDDNPTQGNKAGGLSTLADKSLGCVQKGGRCAISDVLKHGDRVRTNGFVLVSGPGNDLTGITGQIAAGAVLTIFTTGRGTPCGFGGPTFRVVSNPYIAAKKPQWCDFNAGVLLEGADYEATVQNFYRSVMDTVNGKNRTKNEINGYYMIGILKDGVTL